MFIQKELPELHTHMYSNYMLHITAQVDSLSLRNFLLYKFVVSCRCIFASENEA